MASGRRYPRHSAQELTRIGRPRRCGGGDGPGWSGRLLVSLLSLLLPFFLQSELSFLLLFPLAFVLFSFVAHFHSLLPRDRVVRASAASARFEFRRLAEDRASRHRQSRPTSGTRWRPARRVETPRRSVTARRPTERMRPRAIGERCRDGRHSSNFHLSRVSAREFLRPYRQKPVGACQSGSRRGGRRAASHRFLFFVAIFRQL